MEEESVQNSELSEEEKRNLIKVAIKNGCEDSKYILILTEWSYFHSTGNIRKIAGDAEYVLLRENLTEGQREWEYAIIPKTRITVLVHKEKTEFDGDEEHATLYVFTKNGWKSLHLY